MMVGANNSADGYFFAFFTGVLVYMKVSDKLRFEFRAELPMLCRSRGDHSNYLF